MLSQTSLKRLERLSVGECLENEPLSRHTSFGIGGLADLLVLPKDENQLCRLLRYASEEDIKIWILGNGSNVLISDEGLRGIVVKLDNISALEFRDGEIICGGGANLSWVARQTAKAGLSGLEFAAGIPATVGGAVYMNAGADGHSIGELVSWLRAVDREGNVVMMDRQSLQPSYRHTSLSFLSRIVVTVCLTLNRDDAVSVISRLEKNLAKRMKSQPIGCRSAGSFFKNPPNDKAGRLIEEAGCKGLNVGGAEVSGVHANFIINKGGATAADVLSIADKVQQSVYERFGVWLEPEVRYIN